MWDRRNYLDTDFGLEGEESFEPVDPDVPDDFDFSLPHIMTVLGPIEPEQLGVCQSHEHILSDPIAQAGNDSEYRLDRIDLASEELESFITAGGRSMVDMSTRDYGRNVNGLQAIAQRIPVNIIAVTGRHDHASMLPNALGVDSLESEFRSEVEEGVDGTGVCPGLATWGVASDEITAVDRITGTAVARVAVATGLPVAANSGTSAMAQDQLDLLEGAGADPVRVILGQFDAHLNFDLLKSLGDRGAWLSFPQVGRFGPVQDKILAMMLVRLAESGFGSQLLVSQGLNRTNQFVSYGGAPGWIHLLERFTLEVMHAGEGAELVRTLLIDNPARALTIERPP
jgi:phosphotriesterase-related protein